MFTIEMFEILSIRINFSICYELDVTSFRLSKDSSWHFFKVIEVLRPDIVKMILPVWTGSGLRSISVRNFAHFTWGPPP